MVQHIFHGQFAEPDLKACICPYKLPFWEFEGSRAQLEAEGVIPAGTQWPEAARILRYEAGRFRYLLCRRRPDGMKGPMKVWTAGDWWSLRCELIDGPDLETLRIREKKRELAEAIYSQSPAGRREWDVHFQRYWKAHKDEAFQAFKAKFAPQREKRGRPARSRLEIVGGSDTLSMAERGLI